MFLCLTLFCFVLHFIPETDAVSPGAIRLYRDGASYTQSWSSGIVQIYYDDEWGNICDDSSFGSDEADVICHQLGYTGASSFTNTGNTAMYGSDSSGVAMDDVSCSTSSYKAITQCSFSTAAISSSCTNGRDVIVECDSTRIWDDSPLSGDIRLTGGTYSNEGRLEVYCNGQWGTVCNEFFLGTQAILSCKQLGFNNYNSYNYFLNIPTNNSQSIWLNGLGSTCSSSTDTCLTSCGTCPVSALTSCTHSQDVTLECEYSFVFDREQDTTTETICYDQEPAPVGTVRFFRNGSPDTTQAWHSGIVQVYYSNQWGNVYDDDVFGSDEADVICHQLGFTGASYYSNVGTISTFGTDASKTVIRSLNCATADPIALTQCPFSRNYNPTSGNDAYDVVLTCYVSRIWDLNPSPGDIRLTGGKYSNEGLLEVYCGSQWGTVCDNSFTATEASIACRQLGYNNFDDYNRLSMKGSSSQKIWLDTTITCSSSTDTCLTSCGPCSQTGITSCNHDEDVTLACGFSKSAENVAIVKTDGACATGNSGAALSGGVRLIRAGSADTTQSWSSGIVQIYYDDRWGNICNDNFGSTEADVVCHQLGYTGASSYSNTGNTNEWGTDTSPGIFTQVTCSSSAYLTVTQCSFSTSSSTGCDDMSDVIVSCYSTRIWDSPSPGDIRLNGGDYTNQGLLEVYCNGEWGTVCSDYFQGTHGVIACRQLGYNDYESYTTSPSSIDRSQQSIWLHVLTECFTDDICLTTCGGCPSYSVSFCDHNEDIYLSCKYSGSSSEEVSTDTSTNCDISSSAGFSTGAIIGVAVGGFVAFIVCLIACVGIPICICVCCGVGLGAAAASGGKSGTKNKPIAMTTQPAGSNTTTTAGVTPLEHYPTSYPANPNTAPQEPPPSYSANPNPVYPSEPPYPYPN